ncbi:MAG: hypothetical protein QM719_01485 [Thermomonas sp.]
MHWDSRESLSLVVRRFIVPPESIELAIANADAAGRPSETCRIWCREDDDAAGTAIYSVTLPECMSIRPVDWRRFAYDHENVASLVARCANDNFGPVYCDLRFPSEAFTSRLEFVLAHALRDLNSIFDLGSVKCEMQQGSRLLMQITGEYKNGEATTICIEQALPT